MKKIVFKAVFFALISIQGVSFASDVMPREKAQTLANTFFQKKFETRCGGVADGVEKSAVWEFQPYLGFEAKPMIRKIKVNKRTGKTSFSFSFKNFIKHLFP